MSETAELESRITAALDRIGRGVEKLSASSLAEELAAERMANAQLEERVRAIKERQETVLATLEADVAALRGALTETDAELQRLRSVNAELRKSNGRLREANSAGLADATLVNDALAAELSAVSALRDGDRAELDRILGKLAPLMGEAANA